MIASPSYNVGLIRRHGHFNECQKMLKGNSTETFSFWLQCVLMVLIQFTLHCISGISVVCNLYCQADTIITCHPPTENFLRTLQLTYTHVWYIIGIISSSPSYFCTEKNRVKRCLFSWRLFQSVSHPVRLGQFVRLDQSVRLYQSVKLS